MTTNTKPRFQSGWTLQVTLKRLLHQWRNLLTMVMGVLLAAVIGASIPLYTAAVGQVGLQQTLSNADRAVAHIALRTGTAGITQPAADSLDADTQAVLNTQLGDWTQEIIRWQETLPLPPERDGEVIPATRLRLGHYRGWESRVVLEDGLLPTGHNPAGVDIEAVASLDLAQALDLHPGDMLTLRDGRESSTPIRVRISGLVKAADPDDPFWPPDAPPMQPAEPVGNWQVQGTLLIAGETFYPLVTGYLPETTTNLGWRALMNHPAITLEQIPTVVQALDGLNEALEKVEAGYISVETGLGPLLAEYAAEAELLGAPFGLLIIQMGALTVYFMLMTAELIRHNERREISLIRSRGGSEGQVWALRALEAFIICLVMVAMAPWMARAGLQRFGSLGALQGLEIGVLPLVVTPAVYAYAAGAGLVSWGTLMLTLRPVLRAPLGSAGGVWERPEQQAWWQRYYVDVALLVLGGIAFWQLSSYGSVLVQRLQGGLVIDPLLLLTPSLLMLAVGALSLRLFNPAMNLLSYLFTRRDGLTAQLAGWQISRRPVHHSRIALMLALAISMGWFATGFNATVARSRADRAGYAAGADLRLAETDTLLGQPRTHSREYYRDLDGVQQASLALRSRINASTRTGRSVYGELLGVDPHTFSQTANWRSDLGHLAIPAAEGAGPPPPGRPITSTQGSLHRLSLWLKTFDQDPADVVNRLSLFIKVQDDDGLLVNVPLELGYVEEKMAANVPDRADREGAVYQPTGWIYLEADLTQTERPLAEPLRLLAIHWTYRSPTQFGGFSQLALADLMLYDQSGEFTRLDWLDSPAGWSYLDDGISPSEGEIRTEADSSRTGGPQLRVGWTQDGRTSAMGIVLDGRPPGSLPAVVSASFLRSNGLTGQEPFHLNVLNSRLTFHVVGVVNYYPSLYAAERPFLVTDLSRLLPALNHKPGETFYANEVWLKLVDPEAAGAIIQTLESNGDGLAIQMDWQVTELERQMQANPLTIGLTGLFFIAFGVALVLSAASLLSYVALTAQARRVEFSILQSLGMAPRRLLFSLALEQGLVLGTGTLIGAVLGALLGRQILPFLSVTEMGRVIVPPFIVETGVDLLLRYALIMLGIFALLMLSSLWLLRRLPLARTLRLGDE